MLVLLFLKVPVFISVLGGSLVYFLLNPDINSVIFAQQMILGTEKISLLAIPFFVCAGIVMNYTGVTKRIMDFCEVVTAHLPGGLAQVNVLLSTVMGGLSGSNLADAAMEAKMLIPEMTRKGFSLSFSSVVTAASSMITPLIPPGIAMILYGCIANVSIGKLFVSGIGVGGLLCISMMILVGVISKKRHYGKLTTEKLTGERVKKALKPAILPLLLPIIIIGGIRVGAFTATEAGAVAIIYAIFLGFLYRDMKAKDLVASLKETVASTSWILTRERVPQTLTEWMLQTIDNKFVFLIAVNIFLLIVGMFIEGNASMIILVPLLAPIAAQYGINEIQFAMIYIFNNAIGALSPPMGTLMFVTCSISKCPTADFIKEGIPFYIMLVVDLILITYFEPLTLFLVNLIY